MIGSAVVFNINRTQQPQAKQQDQQSVKMLKSTSNINNNLNLMSYNVLVKPGVSFRGASGLDIDGGDEATASNNSIRKIVRGVMQDVADSVKTSGTIDWYNENAEAYFNETVTEQLTEKMRKTMYPLLTDQLPLGEDRVIILDAGCGGGRDVKGFSDMGYEVEGIEPAEKLAKLAENFTKKPIHVMTFQEMKEKFPPGNKYDGIWACASMLHVPKREFDLALNNLIDVLKPGGTMVVSLKKSTTEEPGEYYDKKGRFFNYFDMNDIQVHFYDNKRIEVESLNIEKNNFRKGDHDFINMVLKKVEGLEPDAKSES